MTLEKDTLYDTYDMSYDNYDVTCVMTGYITPVTYVLYDTYDVTYVYYMTHDVTCVLYDT